MKNVCETFGIETQGDNILCPEHNDNNFGSCKIYHNRYKCFACGNQKNDGHAGNNVDLIRFNFNLSKRDASLKIAEAFNIPEYEDDGKRGYEKLPVSQKQLGYLGLERSVHVRRSQAFSDIKFADFEFQPDIEGYIYGREITVDLMDMYKNDKEAFNYMIKGKISEKLPIYINLYNKNIWKNQIFSNIAIDVKTTLEDAIECLRPIAIQYGLSYDYPEKKKNVKRYKMSLI